MHLAYRADWRFSSAVFQSTCLYHCLCAEFLFKEQKIIKFKHIRAANYMSYPRLKFVCAMYIVRLEKTKYLMFSTIEEHFCLKYILLTLCNFQFTVLPNMKLFIRTLIRLFLSINLLVEANEKDVLQWCILRISFADSQIDVMFFSYTTIGAFDDHVTQAICKKC